MSQKTRPRHSESYIAIGLAVLIHLFALIIIFYRSTSIETFEKPIAGILINDSIGSGHSTAHLGTNNLNTLPKNINSAEDFTTEYSSSNVTNSPTSLNISNQALSHKINHDIHNLSQSSATEASKNNNSSNLGQGTSLGSGNETGSGYGIGNNSGLGYSSSHGSDRSYGNSQAHRIGNQKPPYPTISRKLGEQGVVYLSIYILENGNVTDVSIKQSSGYRRLDESALKAVRHWRYIPAKRNGQSVAIRYIQAIRFSLDEE